jgi:hypothetical protein
VTIVYVWIALSVGFALGWFVRAALARRRREEPSSPLHTIDLRSVEAGRSQRVKGRDSGPRTVSRSRLSSN